MVFLQVVFLSLVIKLGCTKESTCCGSRSGERLVDEEYSDIGKDGLDIETSSMSDTGDCGVISQKFPS